MKIRKTIAQTESERYRNIDRRIRRVVNRVCKKFGLRSRPHRSRDPFGVSSLNGYDIVKGGLLGCLGGTTLCVIVDDNMIRCVQNRLKNAKAIASYIEEVTGKEVTVTIAPYKEL